MWETRKFLILVKTYPNPSRKAREAVCTAGIDEAGNLTRLFPIPFRTLAESQRFKKWQWIKARVRKARNDSRRESFEVEYESIEALHEMPSGKNGWRKRWERIAHLVSPSLESVITSGASLGLIKPRNYALSVEKLRDPNWTTDELRKLRGDSDVDLFGNKLTPTTLLEKLPVRMRYTFDCQDDENRHSLLFEDWEVGVSWRNWNKRYPDPDVLDAALRETYVDKPRRKDNLYFFVGNIAAHPQVWMVIGQIQPDAQATAGPVALQLLPTL